MSDVVSSQLAAIPPQQCDWNGRNAQTQQHETDAQWQSMVKVPAVPALHCHVRQPVPMTPSCLQPHHMRQTDKQYLPQHTHWTEKQNLPQHTPQTDRLLKAARNKVGLVLFGMHC